LRSRGEKAGKPSLSPTVADFFRRSSSIFCGRRSLPVRLQRRGCSRGLDRRDQLCHRPSCWPHGWSSAVTTSAAKVAVRDDLAIAASSCSAVATLRGSAGCCASTVGLGRQLGSSTVTAEVRAATCGFVVTVPGGGQLSDPIVDSHEVSVFCELGDDLSRAHPLGLTCYRSDRHEALLWGSVYPALDLVECIREVADGEGVSKTPASFVPLSVTLTSSVPVGVSLIRGCFSRQLVCGDVFEVSVV
jgi:hypothetical protein